jgi:primosomal replication protein N
MEKPKVKLELESIMSECGDGCCVTCDTKIIVNGHDIGYYDDGDMIGGIKAVLEHLGYEVES